VGKSMVPSGFVDSDWTVFPAVLRNCTVTPGRPTSRFSTTPGLPPPGLKSRQTTPTMSPVFGGGSTACTPFFGTASGAIPVRPRRARPPGARGVFRTRLPFGELRMFGVDGNAFGRTPAGLITPVIERPSALIAPWFGSCWYMIRQVTPVANAEIAIGRKTTVLKATAQRTRSVRTAKISPSEVTNAGTTATQIALFLIAVVSVDVVNSRR